jgi:hypothetical protein
MEYDNNHFIIASRAYSLHLMQETALARAPRHFERVKGGPHINKVLQFHNSLLYMLALNWL